MMKSKLYAHAHKAYQDVLLCNHTYSLSEQQTKELRELLSIFFGLPYSSIETVDEGNSESAAANQRTNAHEFAAVIDLDDDITLDDLDIEYMNCSDLFDDAYGVTPSALNDALTMSSVQPIEHEEDVWDEIMTGPPRHTAYMSSVPTMGGTTCQRKSNK